MFNCPLDNLQTETKGTVLLKSAEELKDFTKGEENMLKNSIEAIQKSGAIFLTVYYTNVHSKLSIWIFIWQGSL